MNNTIKVRKQMHLDELIRHARLHKPTGSFSMKDSAGFTLKRVHFVDGIIHSVPQNIRLDKTFTVEYDEEITHDTVFEGLHVVGKVDGKYHLSTAVKSYSSINDILKFTLPSEETIAIFIRNDDSSVGQQIYGGKS